jgi:hypothetical protein
MIRLFALAAVAAALIVAAAGCGGSSSKSSSGATTTATTGGSYGGTKTTGTSSGTSSGTGSSGSSGTSSGSASGISKSCLDFAGATAKIGQALGANGKSDPETLKKYIEALAAKAPSSIKADFQTMAEAFGKYADALKGVNLQSPSPSDIQKIQKEIAGISTPKVQQAEKNISAWAQGGCKS